MSTFYKAGAYGGPSTSGIVAAAAGTMVAMYDAEHFLPGTPPDTEIGYNRQSDIAYGDASQDTDSQRPHASGKGRSALWNFDPVASQYLHVDSLSPNMADSSDEATVFAVARLSGAAGAKGLVAVSTGESSGGVMLYRDVGGNMNARGQMSNGIRTATVAFTDTDDFHVFGVQADFAGAHLRIDGVVESTLVANAGILNDLDEVRIGSRPSALSQYWDGDIKFVCVLQNPTDTIIDNVEIAIQAYYQTPALP